MRIAIPAQDQPNETFGVNSDYLTLIEEVGHTPVIIYPCSVDDFWLHNVDGLLLPGGADVNPWNYKHIPTPWTQKPNPFLEYFDKTILPAVVENSLPIFGICRGLQTLNVHFGGTLWQHLRKHPYSTGKLDLVHEIEVYDWEGGVSKMKVNSFHHQSIWHLGENLSIRAKSPDNVIEAIEHVQLPIFAVQWHPERMRDELSLNIVRTLFS